MSRDPIDLLVIHHARTPNGSRRYGPVAIDAWHRQRGFKRDPLLAAQFQPHLPHIGYHAVIPVNGRLVHGRAEVEVGAHCKGLNRRSIGVCLLGTDRFSLAQWERLAEVTRAFLSTYGGEVIGHRDHDPKKDCPGFDVGAWLDGGMVPLPAHLLEETSP